MIVEIIEKTNLLHNKIKYMRPLKQILLLITLCLHLLFTNCGKDDNPVADAPAKDANTDDNYTNDGTTDSVTYTLTLIASEGGTVTPESGSYIENDIVELLATPDSTYGFVNWTGSSTSTDNPLSVTMNADQSYTASFVKKQYLLTIIVEGEGAVSEEIITNGRVEDYDVGTLVQLTATPSEDWKFYKWVELDVNTNPLEVSITDSITLTARFYVPVDSFSITPSALQMILGDTDTLKASIYPTNVSDTIHWKSSDESIATVTQEGIVTAIAKGESVITVMTAKDSITNSAQITVILDADRDGVIDENDTCADTPEGATVDINGCADLQKDTDSDGVKDDKDTCTDTPEGAVIDTDGCPLPAIYLDANGVTIKARDFAVVGESYELKDESYLMVDSTMLANLIKNGEDVTKIITTRINNLDSLLLNNDFFNQNISAWDVSNVTTMILTFKSACSFNQAIDFWDVGLVKNMKGMFFNAKSFNAEIGDWNVENVKNMRWMFEDADSFNQNIGNWNVGNLTNSYGMFAYADSFNQNISDWKMGNVTNSMWMFYDADSFNQDISNWDVSNINNMTGMFYDADSFNQDISNWDVSNVNNMFGMFRNAKKFNQDISNWNVQQVTVCDDFSLNTTSWTLPKPNFTNCTQ